MTIGGVAPGWPRVPMLSLECVASGWWQQVIYVRGVIGCPCPGPTPRDARPAWTVHSYVLSWSDNRTIIVSDQIHSNRDILLPIFSSKIITSRPHLINIISHDLMPVRCPGPSSCLCFPQSRWRHALHAGKSACILARNPTVVWQHTCSWHSGYTCSRQTRASARNNTKCWHFPHIWKMCNSGATLRVRIKGNPHMDTIKAGKFKGIP